MPNGTISRRPLPAQNCCAHRMQGASGNVRENLMAETSKLSVEKALEKLRGDEPPKSRSAKLDEEIEALKEETSRMRAQRQRLDRSPPKRS